jgi:hypothetical protein
VKTPLDTTKLIVIAVVVAVILGAVLGGLAIRSCSSRAPIVVPSVEIDAGPGEAVIAGQLDGAVQADEQAIRELEERNQRSIDQFNEQQQAEYDEARRGGRRAVAAWLSSFNEVLKTDAGIR